MNIIEKLHKQNPILKPRGWKGVELQFLSECLADQSGDVLIVGERGSEDGVLATVLDNKNINKPVHCIDIQSMDDTSDGVDITYGREKIKQGEIDFFNEDVVTWDAPKFYDHIACINVLEHFGFDRNGDLVEKDYDFKGFQKMLSICGNSAVFTIPFNPFLTSDDIGIGGRTFGESRVAILQVLARIFGFRIAYQQMYINVDKSDTYHPMPEYSIPPLYKVQDNHEYLIVLLFKRTN